MQWEIDEEASGNDQPSEESSSKWSTRLRLTLQNLGEIDAQIHLQDNQMPLSMNAGNAETRAQMRSASLALRTQLDEAELTLASKGISALPEKVTDG